MTPAVHRAHIQLAVSSLRAGDYRTVDAVVAALRASPRRSKIVLQIHRRRG